MDIKYFISEAAPQPRARPKFKTAVTPGAAPTPSSPAPAAPTARPKNIFTDSALFQAAWDQYVQSKTSGDIPYRLISDVRMLEVLKDMWMRTGGTELKEHIANYDQQQLLVEAINRSHPIYEGCYSAAKMLNEATLSQDQIQQVFQAAGDASEHGIPTGSGGAPTRAGSTPTGTGTAPTGSGAASNRTLLGKITDRVSGAWNKLKTSISQSGPVRGFDTLVDQLQGQIIKATGGKDAAVAQQLLKYRQFAKKHPIMQGAIYAIFVALAATAAGATGPAAIGGIAGGLKLADRLLQGDKASSAIWRAFKTGGVAAAGTAAVQGLAGSNAAQGSTGQSADPSAASGEPATTASAAASTTGGSEQMIATVRPGNTLSQIAQSHGVSVKDLLAANPSITNPDVLRPGMELVIPDASGTTYASGVGTAADTASKVASGQYTPSAISAAQAARAGIRENRKVTDAEIASIFTSVVDEGFLSGLKAAAKAGWRAATNKVTYEKLDMNWRRNFGDNPVDGPVEEQVVRDFLKKQGVADDVIEYAIRKVLGAGPAPTTDTPSTDAAPQPTTIKDSATLRSDFESFMDSGGSISPQVRGVLQDILKTALGTVRESLELLTLKYKLI
jgi:LysM repeat protein